MSAAPVLGYDRCPAWVPAPVWELARELEPDGWWSAKVRAAAARLLGPGMAPTWRRLADEGHDWDEEVWRLLFDLFFMSAETPAAAGNLRGALNDAGPALDRIAELADELADRIDAYSELAERNGISVPDELELTLEWVHRTARADPLFQQYASEQSGFPSPDGDAEEYLPRPVDLLRGLSNAAREHTPGTRWPHQGYVHASRKEGRLVDWVRAFDLRFRENYLSQLRIPGLALGDTDLARIASAVLDLDVRREVVKKARRQPAGEKGALPAP